ncbi:hypothetical protein Cp1R7AA1_228 [Mesorhizobium phage Cp1R7A-A1]|nr:hypothetical protein Cp1R7AA1_228 [Mesorhizobium phage Cp1R7A-A1]
MKVFLQNVVVVTALLVILASEAVCRSIERVKAEYRAFKDPQK